MANDGYCACLVVRLLPVAAAVATEPSRPHLMPSPFAPPARPRVHRRHPQQLAAPTDIPPAPPRTLGECVFRAGTFPHHIPPPILRSILAERFWGFLCRVLGIYKINNGVYPFPHSPVTAPLYGGLLYGGCEGVSGGSWKLAVCANGGRQCANGVGCQSHEEVA